MFYIRSATANLCLVPVAFDHMLFSFAQKAVPTAQQSTVPVRFETEHNLESAYLAELCAGVEALGCPVCLDMRYVASYSSRGFEIFAKKGLPVFFCGITSEMADLGPRLTKDMPALHQYEQKDVLCSNDSEIQLLANKSDFSEDVEALYREKLCELLQSVVVQPEDLPKERGGDKAEDDRGVFLESSAVYVKPYIALKDLFQHMEDALFIVYLMAEKIRKRYPYESDKVLICCSKTGAVFTGILSMLLGMDAVYCTNIGPKFALDVARLRQEIRVGQDYIFVFDFLCMGTEVKILHALVSSMGAHLVYGIGTASYLDLSAPQFRESIFSKIDTLIDIRDAVSDYTVSPVISESVG